MRALGATSGSCATPRCGTASAPAERLGDTLNCATALVSSSARSAVCLAMDAAEAPAAIIQYGAGQQVVADCECSQPAARLSAVHLCKQSRRTTWQASTSKPQRMMRTASKGTAPIRPALALKATRKLHAAWARNTVRQSRWHQAAAPRQCHRGAKSTARHDAQAE